MKFAPTSDQLDFGSAVSALIASSDAPGTTRSWADGSTEAGTKLWRRLGDVGVHGLMTPESLGGFGESPVELVLAFTELGRGGVPGPYVESAAFLPALLASSAASELASSLVDGSHIATVAHAPVAPFAVDAGTADAVYVVDGLELRQANPVRELRSVDAARKLWQVEAGDVVATVTESDLRHAHDAASLAAAAQLYGAGVQLLDTAVEYVKARRQFGRAVGEYQAVKHQLADVKVGLDFTRPLLWGAALALPNHDAASSRSVSAAKVAASRSALQAARTALQVHGAIGYTAELDLSLWLNKVRALVTAWGTPAQHRASILAGLTADGPMTKEQAHALWA